jgi:hypothetical protein
MEWSLFVASAVVAAKKTAMGGNRLGEEQKTWVWFHVGWPDV